MADRIRKAFRRAAKFLMPCCFPPVDVVPEEEDIEIAVADQPVTEQIVHVVEEEINNVNVQNDDNIIDNKDVTAVEDETETKMREFAAAYVKNIIFHAKVRYFVQDVVIKGAKEKLYREM